MKVSHSQYYTSKEIASLMINIIDKESPHRILDLGAGNGSLIGAAAAKWKDSDYIVVDIDIKNCEILNSYKYKTSNISCLIPNLDKATNIAYNSIDVAVCNPPYEHIENASYIQEILELARLSDVIVEGKMTSDIVFLAYNLLFLNANGVLGIIVPYSIMTGRLYNRLRQKLIENYYIERIIELPERSFSYTEAKTGMLIIHKDCSERKPTKLNTVVDGYKLSQSLEVPDKLLIDRMDYTYNNWLLSRKISNNQNDCNLIKIFRGRFTHHELKKMNVPYFHTTCYTKKDIDYNYVYNCKHSIASAGTFLVARVGKRCIGNVLYVESGNIIISDCIYGIVVPQAYVEKFKSYFRSDEYKEYMKIISRGVCSLYLCKGDIERMILNKLHSFQKEEISLLNKNRNKK